MDLISPALVPELRSSERSQVRISCELTCPLFDGSVELLATSVSDDGAWIESQVALDEGAEVRMRFTHPGWGYAIFVPGTIARVTMFRRECDPPRAGMGIAFGLVRPDDRRLLMRTVFQLRLPSDVQQHRTLRGYAAVPSSGESALELESEFESGLECDIERESGFQLPWGAFDPSESEIDYWVTSLETRVFDQRIAA